MKTLSLIDRIGESIVGTSIFSPRFTGVQVGRHVPLVRRGEDAEGLIRAGFLGEDVPIELNLLAVRTVRAALARGSTLASSRGDRLDPASLFHSRPSVAYIPPETLTRPHRDGVAALNAMGGAATSVASLRSGAADGAFWTGVAQHHVYAPWVRESFLQARTMGISLLVPPVPVVSRDLPGAAILQGRINLSAAAIRATFGSDSSIPGLMYGLHFHPNALSQPLVLQTALQQLSAIVARADNEFWGVHVSFTDIGAVTQQGAVGVQGAKEVVREASRIAADAGMFTWVSDTGAVGPALLDEGPAFSSYHPGLSPHKIYNGGAATTEDIKCGKVLEVWNYNLLLRSQIGRKQWTVDDTGLFPNVVPVDLRAGTPPAFRVRFGKPNNIAVAERLNAEREKELVQVGNARPGKSHIGKSNDLRISPWA
jgi:hypothetical protein